MGKPKLPARLGAWLAALFVTAPAAAQTSQYVTSEIWLQRSRDDYVIRAPYYLVPAAPAQVKDTLARALAATGHGGYAWQDDSAPLSSMDTTWIDVTRQTHPEVNKALETLSTGALRDTLRRALTQGVITPAENAAFEKAALARTRFDREEIQSLPFFAQRIERWTFAREHRPLIGADYRDGGGLMDVSPMLGDTPMTLVWFDGVRTTVKREFKLMACMTGVTCFPAPHIDRQETALPYLDAATDKAIHAAAAELAALPASAADARMAPFLRLPQSQPAQARVDATAIAPETLATLDLPADETDVHRYDDDSWRLLGLKTGDIMIAGARSRRYDPRDGALRAQDVAVAFGKDGVRAQPDGDIWGIADGSPPRLVDWSPRSDAARSSPLAMLADRSVRDWTLLASGGVAIRTDNAIHVIDTRTWIARIVPWDGKLRDKVGTSLDDALPWVGTQAIRFSDGLLWDADRDAYGIAPGTGRTAASFTTDAPRLFFGSRDGDWAIARLDRSSMDDHYRIISPGTGQARFDLKTAQAAAPAALARTAHGRLLAISSDTGQGPSTTVLDMRTGKVIATLAPPGAYRVKASAFSWQGTQLWLYLESADMRTRKMARWDVPKAYIDAADEHAAPDQMRCVMVRAENCGNY